MPQESPLQPVPGASQAVLTPGQLKALYPYQFAGRVIYLHFARGWMPVMADMCREVDELMRGRIDRYEFFWIQFKEKFGIGRFYFTFRDMADPYGQQEEYSPEAAELRRALLEVKLRAEGRTASLCEVCGQPAELIRDQGWLSTLCPEHAAMLRRGERLSSALADDGSEWRE